MTASWEFRGGLLVFAERGETTNADLERAFVHEALADPQARPGLAVLWDARGSQTAVTAEDMQWRAEALRPLVERGLVARIALLLRRDQSLTAQLASGMFENANFRFQAFTDESDATEWLARP